MASPLTAAQDVFDTTNGNDANDAASSKGISAMLMQRAKEITPNRLDVSGKRQALEGAFDKLIQAQQYRAPESRDPGLEMFGLNMMAGNGAESFGNAFARSRMAQLETNKGLKKDRQDADVASALTGVKKQDSSLDFLNQDQKTELELMNAAGNIDARSLQAQLAALRAKKVITMPDGSKAVYDSLTDDITPINGGASDTAVMGGATGDDFLKTQPANEQTIIKGLAEGRMAFPTGMALRSPVWQKRLQAVAQYDPEFDAVNYNARSKTRNDFTSGKSAQNITAMNTAIGHLDTLRQAAEKLHNRASPMWNEIANWAETATGDPRVKNFNVARDAVKSELTRVFRGTGGNVADLKDWEANLNAADSPEQLQNVIKSATELLGSRLDAVGDQYSKGMGKASDPLDLLNPKTKKIMQNLLGEKAAENGTPEALPAGKSKLPPALEAAMKAKGLR